MIRYKTFQWNDDKKRLEICFETEDGKPLDSFYYTEELLKNGNRMNSRNHAGLMNERIKESLKVAEAWEKQQKEYSY